MMIFFQLLIPFILLIIIITFTFLLFKSLLYARTLFHGPPYVPIDDAKMKIMIKLANIKKGEKVIDLGSGDGKILFALAEKGVASTGVEINPDLVKKTNELIKEKNLEKLVTVTQKNFWNVDISQYDVIFLYGTTFIMKQLEKKLQKEMKSGARIISNYFEFPNWKHEFEENEVRVYSMSSKR